MFQECQKPSREAELEVLVTKCLLDNQRLRDHNQQLQRECNALRDRLNTNSRNSSVPPSRDPFRKKRQRKRSDRKQGAQPGHKGHQRAVFPPDQVGRVEEILPKACPSCGSTKFDSEPVSVEARQVVELPAIHPEVSQYNIYCCSCQSCHKHVKAEVPGVARRLFGPRLMGFITLLAGDSALTKRKLRTLLKHLGIEVSIGTISNIHKLATRLFYDPYIEIRAAVLRQCSVHGDETSWRLKGKIKWLWIGTSVSGGTFFKIGARTQEAFKETFGGFCGTLTTDRCPSYNTHPGKRQVCLAHISRDFNKISERPGLAGQLGRILKKQLEAIFHLWHEFRRGKITRRQLQEQSEETRATIRAIFAYGASEEDVDRKSRATLYNLFTCFDSFWIFMWQEGVEPTNNLAERGIRPAVILRKLTNGSQSEWGLQFTERLLTVVNTLKQRAANIFDYMTQCFTAYVRDGPSPSALA
jgi:transposase